MPERVERLITVGRARGEQTALQRRLHQNAALVPLRIAKIENAFGISIVIGKHRRGAKREICASGKQHSVEARRRQLETCRRVLIILRRLVAGECLDRGLQRILVGKLRRGKGDKILRRDAKLRQPLSGMPCEALAERIRGGDDPHLVAPAGQGMTEKQINLLFRHIAEEPASTIGDFGIVRQRQHRHAGLCRNLTCWHHGIREQRTDNDVGLCLYSFAGRHVRAIAGCIEHQKLDLPVAEREQSQFCAALQFASQNVMRAGGGHKQRDPHDPRCLFRHQKAFGGKTLFTPCQHRKGGLQRFAGKRRVRAHRDNRVSRRLGASFLCGFDVPDDIADDLVGVRLCLCLTCHAVGSGRVIDQVIGTIVCGHRPGFHRGRRGHGRRFGDRQLDAVINTNLRRLRLVLGLGRGHRRFRRVPVGDAVYQPVDAAGDRGRQRGCVHSLGFRNHDVGSVSLRNNVGRCGHPGSGCLGSGCLRLRCLGQTALLDRDTAGRKTERQTYNDGESPEHHPELSIRDTDPFANRGIMACFCLQVINQLYLEAFESHLLRSVIRAAAPERLFRS